MCIQEVYVDHMHSRLNSKVDTSSKHRLFPKCAMVYLKMYYSAQIQIHTLDVHLQIHSQESSINSYM